MAINSLFGTSSGKTSGSQFLSMLGNSTTTSSGAKTSGSQFLSALGGSNKTQPTNTNMSMANMSVATPTDTNRTVASITAPKKEATPVESLGSSTFSYVPPTSGSATNNLMFGASTAIGTPQKSSRDTMLENYTSLSERLGTRADRQSELEKEFGVSEKADELAKYSESAARIERQYENQLRRLQENPEGMLREQLVGEEQNLRRKASQELADIAIVQNALQGNLQTARQLVADKVAAEFEPIEQQLNSLKDFYSLYQDDLTASEKMQLQAQINRQQFDYENSVSNAIANESANSFLEAYAVGGIDAVPKDYQAQVLALANRQGIASPAEKAAIGSAESTLQTINELDAILQGGTFAVGAGIQRPFGAVANFLGLPTDYATTQAKIEQLTSMLSLENVQKLKGLGAMSDREFRVIQTAAAALSPSMSESEYQKELGKIRAVLEDKVIASPASDPETKVRILKERTVREFPNLSDTEVNDRVEEAMNVLMGTGQTAMGNVPQRNNNPGNIKSGGLADDLSIGIDEQGHLIFPDAQTGLRALQMDIQAKVNGNSRFLPANPTIAQLGKVYAEDPNWANSVSKILGVSPSTSTQSIPIDQLTNAIMRQEGYFA